MKVLNLTSGEYSDFGNVALLYWDGDGDGGLETIEEEFRDFRETWNQLERSERRAFWPEAEKAWNAIEAFMLVVLIPRGWKKLEHETLHESY